MSDLDKSRFADAYDKIRAPQELKTETLSRMLAEDEKRKKNKAVKKVLRFAVPAAAACAALLCFFLIRPAGAPYVTQMEEGVYYDTVELEDGEIHFIKNRLVISPTANLGTAFGEETPGEEEKQEPLEKTETKSGGSIIFQKTDALPALQMKESELSYIGGQEIYIMALNMEEVRFQAVYEKDGEIYEMVGINVSQEEFIDALYKKVKK